MAGREHLGEFEQIVLLAILRLGHEAYGVPIRLDIEQRTGRATTVGALYRTLDRLEDKGYVSSAFSDPTPERGGAIETLLQGQTTRSADPACQPRSAHRHHRN